MKCPAVKCPTAKCPITVTNALMHTNRLSLRCGAESVKVSDLFCICFKFYRYCYHQYAFLATSLLKRLICVIFFQVRLLCLQTFCLITVKEGCAGSLLFIKRVKSQRRKQTLICHQEACQYNCKINS